MVRGACGACPGTPDVSFMISKLETVPRSLSCALLYQKADLHQLRKRHPAAADRSPAQHVGRRPAIVAIIPIVCMDDTLATGSLRYEAVGYR